MAPTDTRRVVGAHVHAKALHVTNKAECAHRYRSQAKRKMLLGTVVHVASAVLPSGRTSTNVTCDFILAGDVTKRATLNIRSIKEGRIPTSPLIAGVVPTVPTAAVAGAPGRTNPGASAVTASAVAAVTTTDHAALVTAELAQGIEEISALAADVQHALDTFDQPEQVATPTNPTDTDATETEASLQDLEESFDIPRAETTTTPAVPGTAAVLPLPPTPSTPQAIPPVTAVHGVTWYADHQGNMKLPIKGDVPPRSWAVRTPVGDMLGPAGSG